VRIVSIKRLRDFWKLHRAAQAPLRHWYRITKAAQWGSYADARRTFGHADQVTVASGNRVTVFNIGGNNYRLVAAVHYNRARVFVLRVLTHAEYDRGQWKEKL
jgi:mRNA interferase HigB